MADSQLTIALVGAEELQKKFAAFPRIVNEELAKALNKGANDAVNEAVKRAPHKEGRLWGSLHMGGKDNTSHMATPNSLVARVGTKLEYARAQEYGTQGMRINVRNGRRLKSGGRTKPYTYIGNIKPKFYMRGAKQAIQPKMSSYLEEATKRIVSRVSTGG